MVLQYRWLWVVVCGIFLLILPAAVAAAPNKSMIAAGHDHALAIRQDGSLWVWGKNDLGQLGLGTYDDIAHPKPTRIGTGTNWVAVAAGANHSLALKADGSLWAWGYNYYGQVGQQTPGALQITPIQVGGTGWAAVAAGGDYSLGLKTDGYLWAWGNNHYGQLGLTADDLAHPTPTPVGTGYFAIAAAFDHNLGLNTDGYLYACGFNNYGQLGLGTANDGYHSTRTPVGTGYVTVAAGGNTSLTLKADNSLWTWGINNYGQLGLGDTYTDFTNPNPQAVIGTNWVAAAGGGDAFSLGLKADGSLWAWGNNEYCQLGQGIADSNAHRTPIRVGTAANWVAIAAGFAHSLGLKADGSLWAWGNNSNGQLGLGDTTNRFSPTKVWPRANPGPDLLILD